MREIFSPVVHTVNRKTGCRAHVWSIKAGKLAKIETNKYPTKSTKKMHSSRKKRNKSCLCFDTSLIQSFNIKFKVRSLKQGHIYYVLVMKIYFSSHELLMNYYSVGIRTKQRGTVKNVEHSKNHYHKRSKKVPKDWHSGDFDAKWQEKEFRK